MGIKGLSTTLKIINEQSKIPGIVDTHVTNLVTLCTNHDNNKANIRIAIDFMELAYHWVGTDDFEFITNCFKFLKLIINARITPIFCFDGMPPDEKNNVIDIRRQRRLGYSKRATYLSDKIESISSGEHYVTKDTTINLSKKLKVAIIRSRKITPKYCEMFKYILDNLGMDYIHDPNIEGGELLCAQLQRYGHVSYCMTNDLDVFAMGATIVIRNFNLKTGNCTVYNRLILMQQANLSIPQFIDMCILHGCDYIDRPKGMRINMILPLIQKYNTIQGVMLNWDKLYPNYDISFPDGYNPTSARRMFSTPIVNSVLYWDSSNNMSAIFSNINNSTILDIVDNFMKKYPHMSRVCIFTSMFSILVCAQNIYSTQPAFHY